MRQPYSSGVWITKPGREAGFVAAWREFAEWSLAAIKRRQLGQSAPGSGPIRAVRELRTLGQPRADPA